MVRQRRNLPDSREQNVLSFFVPRQKRLALTPSTWFIRPPKFSTTSAECASNRSSCSCNVQERRGTSEAGGATNQSRRAFVRELSLTQIASSLMVTES